MPRLLIADDSMFQRFNTAKIARDMGFEVQEAADGRQCLECLKKALPDAMLLDLNMPEVTGEQVLEELRSLAPGLPVAVITADIQDTTRRRVLDLGATVLLNKPLAEDDLRSFLARLSA